MSRPDGAGVPRAVQDHVPEARLRVSARKPVDYLIETHYKAVNRPFRCCQPRDLLLQVPQLLPLPQRSAGADGGDFDTAVENYFAVM